MNINDTTTALQLLKVAMSEVKKINYNSSAYWADNVEEIKYHLEAAIKYIENDGDPTKD